MENNLHNRIKGFHHVGFVVSDIDRSIAFYESLGFFVRNRWIEKPEECAEGLGIPDAEIELVSLRGYQIYLELIQYRKSIGKSGLNPANKIGGGHISLETDDIQQLYKDLSIKGFTFASRIIDYPTASWVHLLDPDGIRVELIQMYE